MNIIASETALMLACRFPDKRNTKRRRRRVIGKYGSWEVMRPCVVQFGDRIYAHPTIYHAMRRLGQPPRPDVIFPF